MRFFHTLTLFFGLSLMVLSLGHADYEIYKTDGFTKVHEIIEKKENEDGTFTVRARKSKNSDQVVTIEKVTEIKEVADKSGPKYMEREEPTPTRVIVEAAPVAPAPKSGSADVPWVRKLSKTVVAVVIGIVAAFVILFIWVKSSN